LGFRHRETAARTSYLKLPVKRYPYLGPKVKEMDPRRRGGHLDTLPLDDLLTLVLSELDAMEKNDD